MSESCPAAPANDGERRSESSKNEPNSDSLSALVESLSLLTKSLDVQNSLLMELVDQNSQLIQALAEQDEEDPKTSVDLAGRPLTR